MMAIDEAINKLKTSNQGINLILESVNENMTELRKDPRLEGLVDDLQNLFFAYLKTWADHNNQIIKVLEEEQPLLNQIH